MQALKLCVFLAFIVAVRAYGLTDNLAEFYCVVNGDFTDIDQVKTDGDNRTTILLKFQPVVAPALSELPVLYLEQYNDGVLTRSLVHIVTQGNDNITFVDARNFTGNMEIEPGTVDSKIKSLKKNDLHGQQDCKGAFERVQPFVFTANYQLCERAAEKGQRTSYGATLKCEEFVAVINRGSPEKPTLVPYNIKLQGNKYPLENAPDNYVCNCDKPSY